MSQIGGDRPCHGRRLSRRLRILVLLLALPLGNEFQPRCIAGEKTTKPAKTATLHFWGKNWLGPSGYPLKLKRISSPSGSQSFATWNTKKDHRIDLPPGTYTIEVEYHFEKEEKEITRTAKFRSYTHDTVYQWYREWLLVEDGYRPAVITFDAVPGYHYYSHWERISNDTPDSRPPALGGKVRICILKSQKKSSAGKLEKALRRGSATAICEVIPHSINTTRLDRGERRRSR